MCKIRPETIGVLSIGDSAKLDSLSLVVCLGMGMDMVNVGFAVGRSVEDAFWDTADGDESPPMPIV